MIVIRFLCCRVSLAARRALWAAFTLQITDKLGGVANGGFMKYALLTSGIYILTVLICAGTVRERIAPPPQQKEERFSLIRSAKILFHNDQALVIVVIMILFNLAINLTNAVNVFYFVFVIGSKDQYTFFTILLGASAGDAGCWDIRFSPNGLAATV